MYSQSGLGEIPSIIIAWLVLSFGITFRYFGFATGLPVNLDSIVAGFIATATGFILHEMGHRMSRSDTDMSPASVSGHKASS